jgi:uncharacterized membrane protein YbhN (UPF0104 family)
VHDVLHASGVFVHHLAAVQWTALAIAIGCHLLKLAAVSRAWRNAIAAAYPGTRVSWPRLAAAWVAGTGVNAIVPARGGDAVKLVLGKRWVRGSSYATLGATIVLLSLFDMVFAGSLLAWAIAAGVLPGLDVLPNLPSLDFGWFFRHPRLGGAIVGATVLLLAVLLVWTGRKVEEFWGRVRQGFSVLRDPLRYLRTVAFWQALDWCLRIATIYWLLRAFGLPATAHNAFLVQVSQSVAGAFPLSPSGIGTTEALLLYVLRGTASRTVLLSFSVGMRITLIVVNATLGFAIILAAFRTLSWRRRVEADRTAAESGPG